MVDINNNFLLSEGWFTTITLENILVYQCEFNREQYRDDLFTQLGVRFNPSLMKAVAKRKAEFLAGRYCCKKALSYFNIEDFEVKVGQHRAPQWPLGLKGAITHNSHHAMVALTQEENTLGIGIDIESIMSIKTMKDIKNSILRDTEQSLLNVPEVSEMVACSLIFSVKESFFKAAYPSTGYYFDFDAINIDRIDYQQQRFYLTVQQDLNPTIYSGKQFSGGFAFVDEQVISLLRL